MTQDKALIIWKKILKKALEMPGAIVDKEMFLKKEFSKYYEEDKLSEIIKNISPKNKLEKKVVAEINNSVIKEHLHKVSLVSFAAGIPGGWAVAGTVPADILQFYFHIIIVIQKLAYLHDWPDLFPNKKIDDEILYLFTFFIGIMNGSKTSEKAIMKIKTEVNKNENTGKPVFKIGLTDIAKKIASMIGTALIRKSIRSGFGKVIPFIGGFISGGSSYIAMKKMTNKLNKFLDKI